MKKPLVYGHRGTGGWDKKYAPENTMPAFYKAVEMGADGIELDVQVTKDGHLVICHDETIDRTSDGCGYIAQYTLAELKKFSFSKTHPEYGFVEIPTLEEFLRFMKTKDFLLNIELKTGVIYYEGIELQTAAMVKRFGLEDRVLYSSFSHYSLHKLHEQVPEANIGLLLAKAGDIFTTREYANSVGGEQVKAIHPHYKQIDKAFVDKCHENGLAVNIWTVDPIADMLMIKDWGVDAFITDCPDNGKNVMDGIITTAPVRV